MPKLKSCLENIHSMRWSIEVFFSDSKRLLGLADCSSRDFSAHIAHFSLVMIRYNMLASIKRTLDYDTIGGLFGDMYLGVHELPQKAHIGRVGMAGMPYPQKFGHKKRSPKSLDLEDPK